MNDDDQLELIRIAGNVADGAPVDWEREQSERRGIAARLRHLRVVEDIGRAMSEIRSRWGKLEIRERLGRGGFGEVFRAWDPDLEREVALKLPDPVHFAREQVRERFLTEARRLARVRHPNVLTVHGVDEHDGRIGLWMDLLEGETLQQTLDARGPFGAAEAAAIGLDLCRALAAVHARDLVHGDVKAGNVMREIGGRVVLMDFGCSSERWHGAPPERSGPVSGTPSYMAPELLLGAAPTPAADIYSLGVLLYRLVTGMYPVDPEQPRGHASHVPLSDLRPELPAAFIDVVERALSDLPEDRFQSAGEMERALAATLGVSPRQAPRPARRTPWLAVAAVVTIVIAVGLILGLRSIAVGGFEVEAEVFCLTDGVERRLGRGDRIAPGGRLFLEVEGSRPMHLYVLNEDAAGEAFVLFPLPALDLGNPLPAGTRHRLPGPRDGVESYWNVTSAGGEEVLLVVASRRPLDDLERQLRELPHAGGAALPLEDAGTVTRLRGIGGLASQPARDRAEGAVAELATGLTMRAGRSAGLWVWELRLSNPREGEGR